MAPRTSKGDAPKASVAAPPEDAWPEVEVTVVVCELLLFDVADLTFDADFLVHLDWLDPQLQRGVHYLYNAERGKFELTRGLRSGSGDLQFFNPDIYIENSKVSEDELLKESVEVPLIFDEVLQDGKDVPWLTKRFRFTGALACREVSAKSFPFDIQRLQIKVVSKDQEGVTSLGQGRNVTLTEPTLRRAWRLKREQRSAVPGWASARPGDEAMSHVWNVAYDGVIRGVGEMQVLAMGGLAPAAGSDYVLHVALRRRWFPRYVVDFLIANLQVIAAAASLWVPFTPDMLANRMSITLTVLLTLISSTGSRPHVIESLPYPTLHDHYGQLMVFWVLVMMLANLAVFTSCWGMYRDSGPGGDSNYDYYDEGLRLVVSNLYDRWWCEEGPLWTSKLDFYVLVLTFVFLVVVNISVLVAAQVHRMTVILHTKHVIDASDRDPRKYSRLVFCARGAFEFVRRDDILACATYGALLPRVRLFWRAWSYWQRARRLSAQVVRKDCDAFHPTESAALLRASMAKLEDQSRSASATNRFQVKLSPFELFRVLDVGSGEMGFYSYLVDEEPRCVHAGGRGKVPPASVRLLQCGCCSPAHCCSAWAGARWNWRRGRCVHALG